MPDFETKMENMLFVYETTNSTDFRDGDIKPLIPTVYKEKPTANLDVRYTPLKDVHTLTEFKTTIPFNLLHRPRAIIDTDPKNILKPSEKQHDHGREQAQKTRPRLVMTPAVSMDDVDDPTTRAILCNDMYTTSAKASQDAVASYSSIAAPLSALPAPANPIYLPKLKEPYVSPEWRMDSISWDNNQLRTYCDPTKEFWKRQPLSKCKACDQTATVRAHRKMK